MFRDNKNGFGLVEVLVGASILTAFIVLGVAGFQFFIGQSYKSVDKVQAAFLAEEGVEAMRFIRDKGFQDHISTLSDGSDYYLDFSDDTWSATSTTQPYINSTFKRVVSVEGVNRDSNDDITETGGSYDPNTKKITVSVEWQTKTGTTSTSISTYLMNIHE